MNLKITDINRQYCYVAVKDMDTDKEYFTQGDDAIEDIEYIDKYGDDAFLNYLASSGYF